MPTLRALIKMATASQYKFPTVDLDIEEKEMMNRQEKKVKEKVSKYFFKIHSNKEALF